MLGVEIKQNIKNYFILYVCAFIFTLNMNSLQGLQILGISSNKGLGILKHPNKEQVMLQHHSKEQVMLQHHSKGVMLQYPNKEQDLPHHHSKGVMLQHPSKGVLLRHSNRAIIRLARDRVDSIVHNNMQLKKKAHSRLKVNLLLLHLIAKLLLLVPQVINIYKYHRCFFECQNIHNRHFIVVDVSIAYLLPSQNIFCLTVYWTSPSKYVFKLC